VIILIGWASMIRYYATGIIEPYISQAFVAGFSDRRLGFMPGQSMLILQWIK